MCLVPGFWRAVLRPIRAIATTPAYWSMLCNYPFMEAIKPRAVAHLREWGCRTSFSISDVSRTPFIGQMKLITNWVSSWNILCRWDLYSVATLSQIQTDDWRMEKEMISLFTGRSSWVQTHNVYNGKRMCGYMWSVEGSSRQVMNHRYISFSYVHEATCAQVCPLCLFSFMCSKEI